MSPLFKKIIICSISSKTLIIEFYEKNVNPKKNIVITEYNKIKLTIKLHCKYNEIMKKYINSKKSTALLQLRQCDGPGKTGAG